MKLHEIIYASSIADSSTIKNMLLPENAIELGVVDHIPVFKLEAADCFVYFLHQNNQPLAYLITEKIPDTHGFFPFRQAEKLVSLSGVATALVHFLHYKNIKLVIRSDEPLTHSGIKWVTNIIKNPQGLIIHDGTGRKINPAEISKEWVQSLDDAQFAGRTNIFIESYTNEKIWFFEDQSQKTGLLKNPYRFLGNHSIY